jgi:hypothetical protein
MEQYESSSSVFTSYMRPESLTPEPARMVEKSQPSASTEMWATRPWTCTPPARAARFTAKSAVEHSQSASRQPATTPLQRAGERYATHRWTPR